jgi:uncharacterized BrkB/YihY/UPF0761 family membrane protein
MATWCPATVGAGARRYDPHGPSLSPPGADIAESPDPRAEREPDVAPESARARLQARAARLGEAAKARHEELLARTSWAKIATVAAGRHVSSNGSIVAGYLAYRLFLLLLPLGAIIVALAGFDRAASASTSEHLRLGQAIANTIAQAGQDAQRSRLPLLITGLVAFVFAAWGLLGALQYASAAAWQIPTRKFPGKGRVFVRLAGSLLLFGIVLYLSMLIRRIGLVAGLAGSIANTLAVFVGFMGLGWILPRRCKEWFWLLPGAVFSTAGYVLLQGVAVFYLPEKLANASATYGAFGIALTILFYLFLVGALLWAMLLVDAVVWEERGDDPPGLLRRIADRVPLPTTSFGSGYVGEGDEAETVGGPLRSFSTSRMPDGN